MADLAALGRADAAGLAGRIGRHVVMHHEAIAVLALKRVDDLFVARSAERRRHQRLGLASCEQRGPVGARQQARADRYRTHRAGIAPIDSRFAVEDLAAHDLRFQLEADFLDCIGFRPAFRTDANFGEDARPDIVDRRGARLLVLHLERGTQIALAQLCDPRGETSVLRGRLPVPHRRPGLVDQFIDELDHLLHLLVAENHGAEHHVFGQLLRFRLDHQHGLLRAGDDQIELR